MPNCAFHYCKKIFYLGKKMPNFWTNLKTYSKLSETWLSLSSKKIHRNLTVEKYNCYPIGILWKLIKLRYAIRVWYLIQWIVRSRCSINIWVSETLKVNTSGFWSSDFLKCVSKCVNNSPYMLLQSFVLRVLSLFCWHIWMNLVLILLLNNSIKTNKNSNNCLGVIFVLSLCNVIYCLQRPNELGFKSVLQVKKLRSEINVLSKIT